MALVLGDRAWAEPADSKGICSRTRSHCQRIRGWIRWIQVRKITQKTYTGTRTYYQNDRETAYIERLTDIHSGERRTDRKTDIQAEADRHISRRQTGSLTDSNRHVGRRQMNRQTGARTDEQTYTQKNRQTDNKYYNFLLIFRGSLNEVWIIVKLLHFSESTWKCIILKIFKLPNAHCLMRSHS